MWMWNAPPTRASISASGAKNVRMPARVVHACQTKSIGAATTTWASMARSVACPAVPEPQAYALMLAGLAAVGGASSAASSLIDPTIPQSVSQAAVPAVGRFRSRNGANTHERIPTTRVNGALLRRGQPLIGQVLLREVLADALQPLDERGREPRPDLAVYQHHSSPSPSKPPLK